MKSVLAILVLTVSSALAALTGPQVVVNINQVATVSGNINSVLGGLSASTSPADVIAMSKTLVTSFTAIIQDLTGDITAMQATPPLADAAAQTIVTALDNFVFVHQALLATVIGQHSVFSRFGVTSPIAAVLRSLEATIDSFAFAMIDLIPTQSVSVQTSKATLDSSVGKATSVYEQLCLPIIGCI
ncbi:hypothetical protein B0H15DRAFT_807112 [Mycena belliarum]|uniref:Uncharacterized protein n=1 Tax=Mycena belliarum TaxID=1033014 RepID=A0AAD6XI72_9AGAR|nr:hypothetical protein B0H15DRAFT_807112 [Mycena belliae]